MSSAAHTYGPKCRLARVSQPPMDGDDPPPPINAQFFYSSIIPIDDPLSAATSGASADAKTNKGQVRPFSHSDNNALEKAWLGFISEHERQKHRRARHNPTPSPATAEEQAEKLAAMVRHLAWTHAEKHATARQPQDISLPSPDMIPTTPAPVCCSELLLDTADELQRTFCGLVRQHHGRLSQESVVQEIMMELRRLRTDPGPPVSDTATVQSINNPKSQPRDRLVSTSDAATNAPIQGDVLKAMPDGPSEPSLHSKSLSCEAERDHLPHPLPVTTFATRPPVADDGISGLPFLRVPSPRPDHQSPSPSVPQVQRGVSLRPRGEDEFPEADQRTEDKGSDSAPAEVLGTSKPPSVLAEVAVGVSRLHLVSLPSLLLRPIYWSPVNDIAIVSRATWFYRDTMLPVPVMVANQLEAGYQELRPWTETWNDELRCAIDVGAVGEEKVSHQLWPPEPSAKDKKPSFVPEISTDPFCAARCSTGEAAAEGCIESIPGAIGTKDSSNNQQRSFSNYHVIYRDGRVAFLLKPSLRPSGYYGRRPLARIMRNITVGIPVVRGFDRGAWVRLHNRSPRRTEEEVPASAAHMSHESTGQDVCPACRADKESGQITDLLLVIHGIGQKFAERVESFHFTHAINNFRRAVNVELASPDVKEALRDGQNGIMVLPVNWRHNLSLEDGGPMTEEDRAAYMPDGFGLKDIEPPTIPAVRSLISDIMFDIPFYMSHHKNKMIRALVSEANRVYRLWCRNNPGFATNGRVHLIGHSLGSAMAIEILSQQPTRLPPLDLEGTPEQTNFFDFDTKNLFLAGSPAGFFLLLERGVLWPRRGRRKAGVDHADSMAKYVVGEQGTFGCIAVDNIYNILAREDPIAYLLNGAIDAAYAASLKDAWVPSTATSLLKTFEGTIRGWVPGVSPQPNTPAKGQAKPPTARLPSQLELEIHDFTREEIAEKKAYLLNDNGQVDYYLRSGGGPLEIQYLNMLGAHSSYWTHQDFIRMLCIEIGRKPGRSNTLPAMRAMKRVKHIRSASHSSQS